MEEQESVCASILLPHISLECIFRASFHTDRGSPERKIDAPGPDRVRKRAEGILEVVEIGNLLRQNR
jgi:hypothetical protein